MPLAYVPPEVAFTVRIQRNGEGIQVPWKDNPWHDPETFDDQYEEQVKVYFTYKHRRMGDRLDYRYTFDKHEDPDNEFDLHDLPNHKCCESASPSRFPSIGLLQEALNRGLVRIVNNKLSSEGGE